MVSNRLLFSAIVGTSAMTLFSYFVSKSENENFREPDILGQLIKRLPLNVSKESSEIAGWCTHYAIGVLFVALYNELWQETYIKPTVTSGAFLGAISGLSGIAGWKGIFEIHPHPPAKDLKKYFEHLFLAHLVFGIFSTATYKLLTDN